jgi:hypothetical protein
MSKHHAQLDSVIVVFHLFFKSLMFSYMLYELVGHSDLKVE